MTSVVMRITTLIVSRPIANFLPIGEAAFLHELEKFFILDGLRLASYL